MAGQEESCQNEQYEKEKWKDQSSEWETMIALKNNCKK